MTDVQEAMQQYIVGIVRSTLLAQGMTEEDADKKLPEIVKNIEEAVKDDD